MFAQRFFIFCVGVGLLLVARPATAQADVPPFPVSTAATYGFGEQLVFTLEADPGRPLDRVTLFFSAPELRRSLTVDFTPAAVPELTGGEPFSLTHAVAVDELALAPFTTVSYWWELARRDGVIWQTPAQRFNYDDDQFAWRRLEQNGVEVYWTGDVSDLGRTALDVIADALPEMQRLIPADLPQPLRVYLYPSAADLRAALRLTDRDWVGGHAEPALGVILATAVNPRTAPVDLQRTLPHELAHLLLYELTGEKYALLPFWLNEGLSTLVEQTPNPNYDLALADALAQQETIPLRELCRPVLRGDLDPTLAYAQSAAIVRYLQQRHGDAALRGVLAAQLAHIDPQRQRINCDAPLTEAFGLTLEGLEAQWLEASAPQSTWVALLERYGLWLVLIGGGFLATLLLFLGPRQRPESAGRPAPEG